MDRSLYVNMTGTRQVMDAQAVTSHNIANANTPAYKAIEHAAVSREVSGPGAPTRVNTLTREAGVNLDAGTLMTTGRDLDVAVRQEEGWIVVQDPEGGESLTRRGDLQLDATGLLTTGDGHPVLGDGGQIAVPPHAKLTIGEDGTVSVVPMGQGPEAQAVVDRIRLVEVEAEQVRRREDGLFGVAEGPIPPASAEVKLLSGHLESSNVNMAEAMVDMIGLARKFELQVRMMRNAEENAGKAAELLRMS
ncbi:flagellar basal body rod protein FlgF [Wenzhouxiangella sp. AB-CW3]|uniref:flagellar basal body rod protein FlgF n=1 Tax=Wenzhouxiangella sp. AB-CW3 TaxID=2771012 RepID=UPI00168ACAEA|nr:flagellar basal body rod protein FlgF [Wenzhouxiangella sp. AB-CW3]QOC21225.1 flagellar basal body rod protein FlgF [Wenzhouxiangella sp. AB-CW3]